jgi:hypothetical protein
MEASESPSSAGPSWQCDDGFVLAVPGVNLLVKQLGYVQRCHATVHENEVVKIFQGRPVILEKS